MKEEIKLTEGWCRWAYSYETPIDKDMKFNKVVLKIGGKDGKNYTHTFQSLPFKAYTPEVWIITRKLSKLLAKHDFNGGKVTKALHKDILDIGFYQIMG
jgi:hypothetical protein